MFCSSLWIGVASIALPLWMFCLLPGVSGCDDLRGDTDFLIPWEPLPLLETYIINPSIHGNNVHLYNLYKNILKYHIMGPKLRLKI